MATIDYTEAQFTTSRPNDAVDGEQLRREFKALAPVGVGFPSTGFVFQGIKVFEFGKTPRATLTTSDVLDAPDIASALAVINGHDALGHDEGLLEGDLSAFGERGEFENLFLESENFDEAGPWADPQNNTTTVLNNAVGPNKQTTADTVTWDVASGLGRRQSMLGTVDGNLYTFYAYIRYAGGPGDRDLNFDLHDGPGVTITATSRWQRFRREMVAGTGGAFFDIVHFGSSAGDSFHFFGFELLNGHHAHDHPYVKTTDLVVPLNYGAAVSGNLLVTDDLGVVGSIVGGTLRTGRATFSADANTETLSNNVQVYACDDTSAVRTLTISSSTIAQGTPGRPREIVILDVSGGAGTNNITISTEGSETINGAPTIAIAAHYGSVTLLSDGSNLTSRGLVPFPLLFNTGSITGLHISNNNGTPDELVNIDPGQCLDSTGVFNIVSGGLISNIAMSGAGGLDAGSVAADTLYALHMIADTAGINPVESLLSLDGFDPTLPAGWDVCRRIGWLRTDATSDFETFIQPRSEGRSRWIYFRREIQIQTGGTATSFTNTTVLATNYIPGTATKRLIDIFSTKVGAASATSHVDVVPDGWDETAGASFFKASSGLSNAPDPTASNTVVIPVVPGISTSIRYRVQPAGDASADIFILGYEDTL